MYIGLKKISPLILDLFFILYYSKKLQIYAREKADFT